MSLAAGPTIGHFLVGAGLFTVDVVDDVNVAVEVDDFIVVEVLGSVLMVDLRVVAFVVVVDEVVDLVDDVESTVIMSSVVAGAISSRHMPSMVTFLGLSPINFTHFTFNCPRTSRVTRFGK